MEDAKGWMASTQLEKMEKGSAYAYLPLKIQRLSFEHACQCRLYLCTHCLSQNLSRCCYRFIYICMIYRRAYTSSQSFMFVCLSIGDLDHVQRLVESGIHPDTLDVGTYCSCVCAHTPSFSLKFIVDGRTALHLAAINGQQRGHSLYTMYF